MICAIRKITSVWVVLDTNKTPKVMKTILIPVDFSSSSVKAIAYAGTVFHHEPIKFEIIYVKSPNGDISDASINDMFRQFEIAELKRINIPYSFHIVHGNLLEKIQQSIAVLQPFLVIMGTNRSSLAKALVKLTDTAIVMIPEKSDKMEIKRIAFANDFHNIKASSALDPLLKLSQALKAQVHIVHVVNEKEEAVPVHDDAEASIEYYLDHVVHEYVGVKSDDIVKAINEYVDEQNIDLLAILIRDHGKNNLHSNGMLIEQLVEQSTVPILILV